MLKISVGKVKRFHIEPSLGRAPSSVEQRGGDSRFEICASLLRRSRATILMQGAAREKELLISLQEARLCLRVVFPPDFLFQRYHTRGISPFFVLVLVSKKVAQLAALDSCVTGWKEACLSDIWVPEDDSEPSLPVGEKVQIVCPLGDGWVAAMCRSGEVLNIPETFL